MTPQDVAQVVAALDGIRESIRVLTLCLSLELVAIVIALGRTS